MPPAFPLYTSPAHMQAQLHIRKANAPDSQAKVVPVSRFPCVMASDPQTPHLQVRLPPSFPGALMLVQQMDKLLLRTGPNTQVQVNENFPVRADDWAQLRPGDYLSCGAWLLQVQFALAPQFPSSGQPAAAPTQLVVESEDEPAPVVTAPLSPPKATVAPSAVNPAPAEEHPIFGHEDGLDLDEMMDADPLLSSVEPELTEELSRLALPSPPTSPKPKKKKGSKARRRSQSVPQGAGRVYLHLSYPSSPDQKTGKRTTEEEYLPLPTEFRVTAPPSPGPASPSESENDSTQVNTITPAPKKKPATPRKKPATPKRQPKKAAKPTTPTPAKKRGRPPARSVVPSTTTAPRPATPTKRKTPGTTAQKPRRATTVAAGAASPGRNLPSRASRGRMLSEEEKSRLSRESNAELRRLIGEKRH